MRIFAILVGATFAISGCASTQKSATTDKRIVSSAGTHECVAKIGPNCRAKNRWLCADGFEDACNTEPNGLHKCVAKKGPGCMAKIMWRCDEGYVNGCDTGQTKNHECVPESTRLGGSGCEQEIALVCAEGFVDRCVQNEREHDGPNNYD